MDYRGLEEKVNWLVNVMLEREEREARISREDVIRNPRLSVGGSQAVSHPVVEPREELFSSPNPPRRQGRYTFSPQTRDDDGKVSYDPRPAAVPAAEDPLTLAQVRAGEERLLKKAKTPPTFSGNEADDEVKEVRDWVEVVDDFFDCVVGPGYDGESALTFVKNNLRGPAHDWMKSKVSLFQEAMAHGGLPESMRQNLRWSEVKKLLVEAFESPQYQVMKRFELQELRLGQGKHKSLPIFNAAFDKLSRRLWPIGTDFENNVILDRVLADEYSHILERSDLFLWRDVVKTGARTLAQWKAHTATVWSAREVLKSYERKQYRERSAGGRGGQFGFRSGTQGGVGSGIAALQRMDVDEDQDEGVQETDTPGAPETSAAAQQMQTSTGGNKGAPARGPRVLTDEQMKIVWDKRLCLQCYKPGHRIGQAACKEKGKPRRKPTVEELKA